MSKTFQKGVTLIELIISITVIGIAVTGVLVVIITAARYSADPMTRQQATIVAQSYMEEILGRPFLDDDDNVCHPTVITGADYSRTNAINVCDYNGLYDTIDDPPDYRPRDITGQLMAGLEQYRVDVIITDNATVNLGGLTGGASQEVLRVEVTVTTPDNFPITLTAYKTNH